MVVVTMMVGAWPARAFASDDGLPYLHIRTRDRELRALVVQAMRASPTVRALIERINASNVVVYVLCESDPNARTGGRLNFVGAGGDVRYVAIRLKKFSSRAVRIAMLAHELQHAVEIADTPSIVDEESLVRAYERMGNSKFNADGRMTFDTSSAVETGYRVLAEVSAGE